MKSCKPAWHFRSIATGHYSVHFYRGYTQIHDKTLLPLLILLTSSLAPGEQQKRIKNSIQQRLWDVTDHFFKVLPRNAGELCTARELHGYTPWYFNIPDER